MIHAQLVRQHTLFPHLYYLQPVLASDPDLDQNNLFPLIIMNHDIRAVGDILERRAHRCVDSHHRVLAGYRFLHQEVSHARECLNFMLLTQT